MGLKNKYVGSLLLIAALLCFTSQGLAKERYELKENDVVLFAGGANMVHLQQAGYTYIKP